MTITKFEQSGLIIESSTGFRMAVDVGSITPIEKLDGVKPVDLFVVSHIHGDHFTPSHIAKLSPKTIILSEECYQVFNPKDLNHPTVSITDEMSNTTPRIDANFVIAKGGFVYETDDVKITFFDVDHGPNATVKVENFGFTIEIDGQKIYFAGDMYNPSGMDVTNSEFDYVFLPVGGFYTFGPAEALSFAKQFKKIENLAPMHYHIRMEALPEFIELAKNDFNVVVL
jgi:L-ascorbate metabolism protein UlaG (beta-lactamase superfamily)